MKEELDMLFLLEHFSLEDLVKAEEEFVDYQFNNTDNLKEFRLMMKSLSILKLSVL